MCQLSKKFTVWKALRYPCFLPVRIKRFVLLKCFLFLHYIFPVENPFFVNAGSALHKVSISLWSAFKQVWQQAASHLSSWCNHVNRSNHAVWNDLSVVFLLPKVDGLSDTCTKPWSGGLSCVFVVSSLPAIVVDGSKSFSFPGCSLIRIVSSTKPGSVSLVHGFTHD